MLTSWVTARRRDGTTGKFEIVACAIALGASALIMWAGLTQGATTPARRGPLFVFPAVCLLAGLLDLNAILRERPTPIQRLSRQLWRMSVPFFYRDRLLFPRPKAVKGSPILFVLAFAPFAAMLFWLVRLRVAKAIARSRSGRILIGGDPARKRLS